MTQPAEPAYRYIPLTHGRFTKVSAHRFEFLNQWQWFATRLTSGYQYAARGITEPGGKQKTILMHRVIMDAQKGVRVDHVSRDVLDNSDENLRLATAAQNAANRKQRSDSRWPYKGVSMVKNGRWQAEISVNGSRFYLGRFDTAEQARDAYIGKAKDVLDGFECFDHREHVPPRVDVEVAERAQRQKKGPRPIRPEIKQPDDPSIRYIALTQGQVAIISAMDFERVSEFYWYAQWSPIAQTYYAQRCEPDGKGKQKRIWLHRFIMDAPTDILVDHINQNGIDCRRDNLRLASVAQNNSNVPLRADNKSGFKGVCLKGDKFAAQITINRTTKFLGYFPTPQLAHEAYRKAAHAAKGEFANFG